MIERAEFPVQRNKTLYGCSVDLVTHVDSSDLIFSDSSTAASRAAYRSLQIAEFRMAVAAIGHEKGNQRSNALDIGTIDYGTALAGAADKSGSSKNAQVRR